MNARRRLVRNPEFGHSTAAYGVLAIAVDPPGAAFDTWFYRCVADYCVTKSREAADRHVALAGRWRPERRPGRLIRIRTSGRPILLSETPRRGFEIPRTVFTRGRVDEVAGMLDALRAWVRIVEADRVN